MYFTYIYIYIDIDERHLLRLGHGQELLETEKDFSKWGRVNYMLVRETCVMTKNVCLLTSSVIVLIVM